MGKYKFFVGVLASLLMLTVIVADATVVVAAEKKTGKKTTAVATGTDVVESVADTTNDAVSKKQFQTKKEKAAKKEKVKLKNKEKAQEREGKPNFKSDFNGRVLTGNLDTAFHTHPEFKALVEEEIELERQSRGLVKKYRAEKNAQQKNSLEAELRAVVDRHFTVRQERRLFELQLFEERIDILRKEIEARNEKKERIVEKRMIDLTGSEEDLRF